MATFQRLIPAFCTFLLILMLGCGGAQYQQTKGVPRQKPLKTGAPIDVVDTADTLAQPVLMLGTLTTVSKKGEIDRAAVVKEFKSVAAAKGCDAIVGLKLETDEKRGTKQVFKKQPDGKVEQVQEEVVTTTHTWTAQCARSATVDSGTAKPAAAPAPVATPKAAVAEPTPEVAPATLTTTTPSDPAVQALVDQLVRYQDTYLALWKEKLHKAPLDVLDALGATVELMAQVDRFWKMTVPHEWLGCKEDPKSETCRSHAKLLKNFKNAEELEKEVKRQNSSGPALGWLKKNAPRLNAYLDTYVPVTTSDSGMRGTKFWADNQGN